MYARVHKTYFTVVIFMAVVFLLWTMCMNTMNTMTTPKETFTASIVGSESLPMTTSKFVEYECPTFPVFSSTPKIKILDSSLQPSSFSSSQPSIPDKTFPDSEVYTRKLSPNTSGCQSPLCRFDVGDMYFLKKFQEDTPYVITPSTCS